MKTLLESFRSSLTHDVTSGAVNRELANKLYYAVTVHPNAAEYAKQLANEGNGGDEFCGFEYCPTLESVRANLHSYLIDSNKIGFRILGHQHGHDILEFGAYQNHDNDWTLQGEDTWHTAIFFFPERHSIERYITELGLDIDAEGYGELTTADEDGDLI